MFLDDLFPRFLHDLQVTNGPSDELDDLLTSWESIGPKQPREYLIIHREIIRQTESILGELRSELSRANQSIQGLEEALRDYLHPSRTPWIRSESSSQTNDAGMMAEQITEKREKEKHDHTWDLVRIMGQFRSLVKTITCHRCTEESVLCVQGILQYLDVMKVALDLVVDYEHTVAPEIAQERVRRCGVEVELAWRRYLELQQARPVTVSSGIWDAVGHRYVRRSGSC